MFLLYATRKGYSPSSSPRRDSHSPRKPQPEHARGAIVLLGAHAFVQLEAAQFRFVNGIVACCKDFERIASELQWDHN
jgi:hypothetical protein